MKLYVGNLAFATSSQDLQELFAQAGTVESASTRVVLSAVKSPFITAKSLMWARVFSHTWSSKVR